MKIMKIVGHRKMSTTDGYLRRSGIDVDGVTDVLKFGLDANNEVDANVIPFNR